MFEKIKNVLSLPVVSSIRVYKKSGSFNKKTVELFLLYIFWEFFNLYK